MPDVHPPSLAFPDPIVLVAPAEARAFLPRRAAWSPGSPPGIWGAAALPVPFVLASPVTRDVGDAAGAELDVALRAWSFPSCSGFRARYEGASPGAKANAGDGLNVVVVHEDVWPAELVPGAVAQTVVTLDAGGAIRDADIHLNAVEWRFSLDGRAGTFDLRSVFVHELGHALGLGHTTDAVATMAPNGSGTRWRSLEADDVAGACALYPGVGDGGCASAACPSGYVCVAGRCQRPADRTELCAPCDPAVAAGCEGAGDDARCVDPTLVGLPLGGSVCGRGCRSDADCGGAFTCRATTEAGDLQCIALDGCRSAASPCLTDEECDGSRCASGACVGPTAAKPDAGVTGSSPRPPSPESFDAEGGACTSTPGRAGTPETVVVALASTLALLRRRRRRAETRGSSPDP